MKSYIFSNWRYCKICGHTNKEFKVFPNDSENKYWMTKWCKECYLERRKKYDIAYRKKESYRAYQSKYHKEYYKNNKDNARMRVIKSRIKKRKKEDIINKTKYSWETIK